MAGDQYSVRVFRTDELPRVMHINTACLPENYSSFFYRDLYQKYPETFLVAEADGEAQGYIMCRVEKGWSKLGLLTPARLCHVVSVAVMEGYRRRGLGRALVVEAMRRGRDVYGVGEGYLEVRVSNVAAIGLYDVLGFRKVKRNYGYYMDGEDAWVMAVSLAGF
ncbi:MAG: N-acetyltransferase [Candidatus Bathyarchaeota archaeon]